MNVFATWGKVKLGTENLAMVKHMTVQVTKVPM
jgi:hypothetical protein